ncbi:MAG TPA: glycosyltransferase family 1 protein [Lachnospiraceae bacterium]|nr:glycosyltransferase family 1 protein [Lachnospiraceae bacterium]
MIRMLHIVGSMSPSGIGNFIMNIYRNIDRDKVQFDFIAHEQREISFDQEILAMGGKIYYVTRKAVNPWKNFLEIKRVVKKGCYTIVFRHTDTAAVAVDLLASKLGGAKRRIAHSHSTSTSNKKMHQLFQPMLHWVCTDYFACSKAAGTWLYGNKSNYEVIWNGIDIDKFTYNIEKRNQIRKDENLEDCLVLGHIGNFMPVKNHKFLISLFAKIHEKNTNTKLMLVGDGSLRKDMEEQIRSYELEDCVILTGVRNDTDYLLQAMDLFLFPSFYEGMPIALVEAQAAGLPCLISDIITDDVIVTNLVYKMSLEDDMGCWVQETLKLVKDTARVNTAELINEGGFNVKDLAKRYENI